MIDIFNNFPHIVEIYKHHAKQCKYIPRLYRSKSRNEVWSVLSYGKRHSDTYLRLNKVDLGYIYAHADCRSDVNDVRIAGWIMDFIEAEHKWNSGRLCL